MTRHAFTSMGCEIVVAGGTEAQRLEVERIFHARDARFSRFGGDSELNRVNAARTPIIVSEEFARALRHALAASSATRGLVTPAVGAALVAAGYDRSSERLQPDPRPVGTPPSADLASLRLAGRLLERPPGLVLDLNGVVKSLTVDDALGLLDGPAWVCAGGDLACRGGGVDVALPDGDAVRLEAGGLATSGSGKRRWLRGGDWQHHLIDPRTSRPSESPWLDVTVCAGSCLRADVAAKAAFLLGHEGPDWLHAQGLAGRFRGEEDVVVETAAWWHASTPTAA